MNKIFKNKNRIKLLLNVFLIIILTSNAYALTNLSITSKKVSRPFLEGGDLEYEWQLKNIGQENVSSLALIFEVYNANLDEVVLNQTCYVNELSINANYICKGIKMQIVDSGVYDLLIYPVESMPIQINGQRSDGRYWISDVFRVYTITEAVTILGVLLTFVIVWNQFLKGGNIILSHPKSYNLTYDNKRKQLKLKLNLLFQNDGAKSVSVSYLMVILNKGRERIVQKWYRYSNNAIASQFIIPPKGHVNKSIWFLSDYNKNFSEGKYHINIIAYQDGLDIRNNVLNFESYLKITRNNIDFDFWDEVYMGEKKLNWFTNVNYWFMDRLPKGYLKLGAKLINGFLKLFGKR